MKTEIFDLKMNTLNRPIDWNHINKRLIPSMKKRGFLIGKPIEINSKREILDGHHRYMAAKELNIPYYYVQYEIKESLDFMIDVNTTSKYLKLIDYINMFAKQGIQSYREFLGVVENYPDNHLSSLIRLLSNSNTQAIKTGRLLINENKNELLSDYDYFVNNCNFKIDKSFVTAYRAVFNQTKKNIQKLKDNVFGILKCADTPQYIEQFKRLINHNRKKNRIDYKIDKGKIVIWEIN